MIIHESNGDAVGSTNPLPVSSVAGSPIAGQRTVVGAGTPVVLGTATLQNGVMLRAMPTNSGTVYVGGTAVSATAGYPLTNTGEVFVAVDNLSDLWIDSDAAGSKVAYLGT